MTEYEKLVNYAYNLVAETNKAYINGNSAAYVGLILGIGPCMVEDYEGNGHSFSAVDDALHRFVKTYPESKADEGFIEGIGYALDKFPYRETFETIINYVKCELKREKRGDRAFEFNSIEVLTDVKLFMASNYERLKTDPEFMFWLESENEYFKKNYSYTLYT